MDLIKINPQEYGLEEKKASEISEMFKPMLDKMVELEGEYNEVVALPIDAEAVDRAKELRLRYVKVRTGTAAIHKDLKSFYLLGGKFVDGWKNAQLMASQGIEDKLMGIEKHYENIEQEKTAILQVEREAELTKYAVEVIPQGLGEMQEDVWNNFLFGTKTNYGAKIEAEKKAKEDRIAKEKAEKAKQKRIKEENAKLKEEAEERERVAKIEAEKREKAEAERQAEEERERNVRETKLKKERDAHEAELMAKAAAESKAIEEKEKLQAELKAKQEQMEKIESDRLAEEEAKLQTELSKGDTEKVRDLISDLKALQTKYAFKSKGNKKMYVGVVERIDQIIKEI